MTNTMSFDKYQIRKFKPLILSCERIGTFLLRKTPGRGDLEFLDRFFGRLKGFRSTVQLFNQQILSGAL